MLKTLFLLLAFCSPCFSEEIRGKVTSVYDGDTFWMVADGHRIKVRLAGVDTPELKQAFGHESANRLRSLINGKDVTVRHQNAHHRDRLIGTVCVDGRDVGTQLVAEGLAWHSTKYSNDLWLECLEYTARAERRGLWADPMPVAPWEWRKHR